MFFRILLKFSATPFNKWSSSYHSNNNQRIYKKMALKLDQYSQQDKIIKKVNNFAHGEIDTNKKDPYDLCFNPKGVCFGLSLTYIQQAYYRSNFLFRSILWDIEYGAASRDLKNFDEFKLQLNELSKKKDKKNIIYSKNRSICSQLGEIEQFIHNVSFLQFSKKHISSIHSQNDDLVYELAKLTPPIISATYMLLHSEIENIFNMHSDFSPFLPGACYLISLPKHAAAVSIRPTLEFYDPNHGLFQQLKNIIITINSYYEYTDQYERVPLSISLIKPIKNEENLNILIEKVKTSFHKWQKNTPSFDLELLQYNDDDEFFLGESSIHKNNISFDYLMENHPSFYLQKKTVFSSISLIHIDNFKKIIVGFCINTNIDPVLNITLLELSIQKGRGDIVSYLLEKNANIIFSNKKNPTAFHLAVSLNDVEIIEILLNKTPRDKIISCLKIRNEKGANVFDICIIQQNLALLNQLSKLYYEYHPGKQIVFNKSFLNRKLVHLIDHLEKEKEKEKEKESILPKKN